MSDQIHIVCLDAPSPPDYGGAIDMYYKISSLAAAGKKIILHYFNYHANRNVAGLEQFCSEIHSYKRSKFFNTSSPGLPYIVRSRKNKQLVDRLKQDNLPVLLEGLHCSGIIDGLQPERKIVIRMHNDEGAYYRRLAATERNIIKSSYLSIESILIERYMQKLPRHTQLAAVSTKDQQSFRDNYGFQNVHFIPPFVPWQSLNSIVGRGTFCLYHGNMRVAENVAAATWLVEEVFSKLPASFIVAGSGMPRELLQWEKKYENVQVVDNPPMDQLNHLIAAAHINILPSMNQTGVKLKLLHSLFNGRFCITNSRGIDGSGITNGVHIADDANDYLKLIPELFNQEFSTTQLKQREGLLKIFDNFKNARSLSALL